MRCLSHTNLLVCRKLWLVCRSIVEIYYSCHKCAWRMTSYTKRKVYCLSYWIPVNLLRAEAIPIFRHVSAYTLSQLFFKFYVCALDNAFLSVVVCQLKKKNIEQEQDLTNLDQQLFFCKCKNVSFLIL